METEILAWKITYEQRTPMGLTSSHTYTTTVYAKTKRGAQGIYNREIRDFGDYATYLLKIEKA